MLTAFVIYEMTELEQSPGDFQLRIATTEDIAQLRLLINDSVGCQISFGNVLFNK